MSNSINQAPEIWDLKRQLNQAQLPLVKPPPKVKGNVIVFPIRRAKNNG